MRGNKNETIFPNKPIYADSYPCINLHSEANI